MTYLETRAARRRSAGHAADAVRQAQQLVDARPDDRYDAGWVHHAHHVGDLSVLAVALHSRSGPRS
jgi:hypothetical protein